LIEVEPLGRGRDEQEWDSFIRTSRGAVIYHSLAYRNLLVEHLGCAAEYLVARQGGEIRGVLPIMWTADPGERVMNSLPFYGSHGGIIAASLEIERALMDAWNARATDASTLAATMVANPFLECHSQRPVYGLTDERISQVTPLPSGASAAEIVALISREARDNVRRAERRGVSVELDNDAIGEVSRIHRRNMLSVGGLAKSDELFASLPNHLRAGEDFDIWIARRAATVIAALLVLRFNGVAEYYASGTELEHRPHNPHAALLVAAMAHSAQRGCRLWNWGGTWLDQRGVYRFKRKWGAADSRYRYYIQLNDRSLLDATPDELLTRFPSFYVVPFTALRQPVGQ